MTSVLRFQYCGKLAGEPSGLTRSSSLTASGTGFAFLWKGQMFGILIELQAVIARQTTAIKARRVFKAHSSVSSVQRYHEARVPSPGRADAGRRQRRQMCRGSHD